MRLLVVLAVVLAGAFGTLVVRGLPAIAARDRAGLDLLGRERALREAQQQLETVSYAEFVELARERDLNAAVANLRLGLLLGTGRASGKDAAADAAGTEAVPEGAAGASGLEARLAASRHPQLRPDGALHDALLAAAQVGPRAAEALACLVTALDVVAGPLDIEVLELRGGGQPTSLPEVPELQRIEAQLVLSGSLPDDLAILEALAPPAGGGLPAATVTLASLRRIEPERWGSGLHRLATPPVRLSASLEILLPATPEGP